MATRTKDSAPAREKRGTSPSNSPQTGTAPQRRSRPSPSKTSSPKQQGKKPVASEIAHKPNLSRRRSFDRPPSASSTQKTRISPNPTLRSSSFSSKTSTAQKAKDAGKQSSLHARPVSSVKKTGTYVKKQDAGSGSGTAIVKEQVTSPSEKMEVSDAYVVPQQIINAATKLHHQKFAVKYAKIRGIPNELSNLYLPVIP